MKNLFIFVLFVAVPAAYAMPAHDFHTTFMTIQQNDEEQNLEITLRIFAHDLQPTMEKRLNRTIDLGSTKGLDESVFEYINENFALTSKEGMKLETKWVGKELDARVAFYYFEIPYEGELEGTTISNSLFFAQFPEQINYVTVKWGDKKSDLVFTVGDKAKPVVSKK